MTQSILLLIAMVAHEINRAFCQSMGDVSQVPWALAAQWQKDSELAGVEMHLANPHATPADSHASWLAQKVADGWVYGEVKDADKKQHPCCVPYDELPKEQQAKDYIFRAAVHSARAMYEAQAVEHTAVLLALNAKAKEAKAGSAVSGQSAAKAGEVSVAYIGRRPSWFDSNYGTGLSFVTDQVRSLPEVIAIKLLRHTDLFARTDKPDSAGDTGATLAASMGKQSEQGDEQSRLQDIRDSVQFMDKAALRTFVTTHYRQDMGSRDSVTQMRDKAIGLIDQYGIA